jgi:hypothetical protein
LKKRGALGDGILAAMTAMSMMSMMVAVLRL